LSTSRPRRDRDIWISSPRRGETFGFLGEARHFKSLTRDCLDARQQSRGLHQGEMVAVEVTNSEHVKDYIAVVQKVNVELSNVDED